MPTIERARAASPVEPLQSRLPLAEPRGPRLLRLSELRRRVGLGRSTIYRRIGEGTFPAPKALGGRIVAWLESDVDAWIESLTARSQD